MDEKCENCKIFKCFEPTDAKSGVWDGTCQNQSISQEGNRFKSHPGGLKSGGSPCVVSLSNGQTRINIAPDRHRRRLQELNSFLGTR